VTDPRDCSDCRFHFNSAQIPEPLCRRGVTYGRHPVAAVSVKTMRDDHWWGHQACGQEARLWEPTE
jgi:hypothetical protein